MPVVKFGEVGERVGRFGGADIPIYRKPEKLRSRGPQKPGQMEGRQLEEAELSAPETPASRRPEMAAGPPSPPHLGKLLLGDGAGPHPAAVHPAVGPRATPLPGPRVCTSRDPPPAPRRGSAVLTSSARAGSRAPTSFRAPLFPGGQVREAGGGGEARGPDTGQGPAFLTHEDVSVSLLFP